MDKVHRVIRRPLNEVEWSMVRAFIRRTERNDLRVRFGRPMNLDDDETLKRIFDVQAGRGDLTWTPDAEGAAAGLLHSRLLTPTEAEIALIVRSDLQRTGIGEAMLRSVMARSARCGLKMLSGLVLWENTAMLKLAKKVGFMPRKLASGAVEVTFELRLF